jgi:hypothetical protein
VRQDEDLQRFLHARKITTADNLRVVMDEIAQTLRHEELVLWSACSGTQYADGGVYCNARSSSRRLQMHW